MARQAKERLLFIALITLLLPFTLQGCAVALPVAATMGGAEVLGSHAIDGMKVTGKELRAGADFSYPYQKHVKLKLALDHSDWTCYRGKGQYNGGELCLLPSETKKFSDRTWFSCRYGRGGSITLMATRDHTYYCTIQS